MKFIFLVLLLFTCTFAWPQNNQSPIKQAQKAYLEANKSISLQFYDKAIEQLNQAISLDNKFLAAYQQLGDVYRKKSDYAHAKDSYLKLLQINPEFLPLTYFGLAESELNIGDYENALIHFKKYASYLTLSEASKKVAAKFIADCEFSLLAIKNPVVFKPVNLGPEINTKEQEYLPVITADEEVLIFTRQRNRNEDFYKSTKLNGSWQTSSYLSKEINTEMYNEGAQCISPDGAYLFFTGCNRPDGMGRCDIYISKREGKEWSKPFNIGAPINTPGWESQPSLTADGRTLYFVSTRKGGLGGYDIWRSDLGSNGAWSIPINLGPNINTVNDEQSPFIHPDNQTLYFSSNGWPGLGNKDLFFSRKNTAANVGASPATEWLKPQNLGFPINTFEEESGLTISNDGKTAFFASNNKTGFGNLDIYSFELPEKLRPNQVTYVKGVVFDKTSKDLLDAKIQIIDLSTGKPVFDDVSDYETGEFMATMPLGKSFGMNVSKEGYLFYSENFQLDSKNLINKPFNLKIPLQKIEIGGMVVLNNIFFESNKFELLPESKVELQQLITFLNVNPKITIEIDGHTDDIGNGQSNKILSENRSKTVYKYLIINKITADRISYKGSGESKPIADNTTEAGRKINRRTEFKILKN